MPLFRLSHHLEFPPAWLARSDGLLCIGGDLSVNRLLLAYQNGIFPWFSDSEPVLWWSPDPRLVLYPDRVIISRSLKKKVRNHRFQVTIDQAFEQTIRSCARPRRPGEGTWLTDEMVSAYIALHDQGHAHSVETWRSGQLVGGLYGVSIGGAFFGESMFSDENDGSKIALVALARHLDAHRFDLIDCQVTTDHLCRMGAVEIPRNRFLDELSQSVQRPVDPGVWLPEPALTWP